MSFSKLDSFFRSPWFYWPLLLVLLIAGATGWFIHAFEKKEYTARIGMSPEARKNRLLAAEHYFHALGIEAESVSGMELLSDLPSTRDALVIRRMPATLNTSRMDTVFSWVEHGGHLLLVPSVLSSDHPRGVNILERLGVEYVKKECGCDSDSDEKDDNDVESTDESDKGETSLNGDYEKVLEVPIDQTTLLLATGEGRLFKDLIETASYSIEGNYRLVHKEESGAEPVFKEAVEEDGSWLLQYTIGSGKITLLSDMIPFYNHNIGEYDHACFLQWLTRDSDKIWLVYSSKTTSLAMLIWGKVPLFCVAAFLTLLLFLWRLQFRGGTVRKLEVKVQANVLAHIEAIGNYSWRQDKMAGLLTQNRTNLLGKLVKRYLGYSWDQERDVDLQQLARKAALAPGLLDTAFSLEPGSEQEIIEISRAMQELENQLQAKK